MHDTPSRMNFCNHCAAPLELRIPDGDTHLRHVCTGCGSIHYLNPKLVIGCIVEWQGQILLCRRAIEPRHGLWTPPAGFMENGETSAQAAARETLEEACANVETDALFSLVNIPDISQVHLFYRGHLLDGAFGAGPESLESRLFSEADIPWNELAFRSVVFTLRAWFDDRRKGGFGFHETTLLPISG